MKTTTVNTVFACDACEKNIERQADAEGKNSYPYEEGWVFLYNLNFQRKAHGSVPRVERTEFREKHFCSRNCFIAFVDVNSKEAKNDNDQTTE